MEKLTQKEIILRHLKDAGSEWTPAFKLRSVSTPYGWIGHQGDRVCRKLTETGVIERRIIRRYAHYRIRQFKEAELKVRYAPLENDPSTVRRIVEPERPSVFKVASETKRGVFYEVADLGSHFECTCPSFHFKGKCKHQKMAVQKIQERANLKLI